VDRNKLALLPVFWLTSDSSQGVYIVR
jgi:hypothetical protein